MKKLLLSIVMAAVLSLTLNFMAQAAKPTSFDNQGHETGWENTDCATIQEGTIVYSAGHFYGGQPLQVAYDDFGYNYQAHMFKGYYINVYTGRYGFPPYEGDGEAYLAANPTYMNYPYLASIWPYRDVQLLMKWNDAWLANTDCDSDSSLDRHYGLLSYIGSGAWETNHMQGVYEDGTVWTYFVKIVAVPDDAYRVGPSNTGIWYTADGVEIGVDIWGQFAIIQDVTNDPPYDLHGAQYISPHTPGFGAYSP